MAECITPCVTITNESLTNGVDSIGGSGTFDVLMAASREHLKREHSAGRITGSQFAEVYIASMQAAMSASVQFALQKDRVGYDIQAILENIQLTEEQKALIIAQTAQVHAETLNVPKQGIVLDKQASEIDANISLKKAQELQVEAETLNVPKQGIVLDKQALDIDASISLKEAQELQVEAETLNVPKQGVILDKEAINLDTQKLSIEAQTDLTELQHEVLTENRNWQPLR